MLSNRNDVRYSLDNKNMLNTMVNLENSTSTTTTTTTLTTTDTVVAAVPSTIIIGSNCSDRSNSFFKCCYNYTSIKWWGGNRDNP